MGKNNHWLEMTAIIIAFRVHRQALGDWCQSDLIKPTHTNTSPIQNIALLFLLDITMGSQDQISQEPLIPMNSLPSGNPQRDPPPYAYSSLSPPRSPPPPTTKTSIAPPPRESTFSPIPDTPTTSTHIPTTPNTQAPTTPTHEVPREIILSRERLLAQDARFADVVLTHIVLPRARVGILRCKDKTSFAFLPQTEDDVFPLHIPKLWRIRIDGWVLGQGKSSSDEI